MIEPTTPSGDLCPDVHPSVLQIEKDLNAHIQEPETTQTTLSQEKLTALSKRLIDLIKNPATPTLNDLSLKKFLHLFNTIENLQRRAQTQTIGTLDSSQAQMAIQTHPQNFSHPASPKKDTRSRQTESHNDQGPATSLSHASSDDRTLNLLPFSPPKQYRKAEDPKEIDTSKTFTHRKDTLLSYFIHVQTTTTLSSFQLKLFARNHPLGFALGLGIVEFGAAIAGARAFAALYQLLHPQATSPAIALGFSAPHIVGAAFGLVITTALLLMVWNRLSDPPKPLPTHLKPPQSRYASKQQPHYFLIEP